MKLFEIYQGLLESKRTEMEGSNILRKAGIESFDTIISQMASGDKSVNQKNVPIMAFIYSSGYTNLAEIIALLNEYNELDLKRRIKPIQISKQTLRIGEQEFGDFLRLAEFIHGETNRYSDKPKNDSVAQDFVAEKKSLWSGQGIDIYDGMGVGKCISYTQGGLTGKGYGFCIGQPGNTMYQSYRDTKDSTFYFIVDRNHFKETSDGQVDLSDPLHIVVLDNTKYGVELTDADNSTGNISEYGKDVNAYLAYLSSHGVPVDKLINQARTPQETEEENLLGRRNSDLAWFMGLPIDMKSKYIGRGHLLTDEQFDYLIGA
jgi:hypothetical protein